jgi:hypothetical protein
VANQRVHGTTHEQVLLCWDEDQFAMQPVLSGRPPYPYMDDEQRKVARDAYVSWRGSRYSVPWLYAGKEVRLTLLHSAVSEGLHEHTDEECLDLATTIRIVLTDLAERIGLALKDQTELNAAVTKLMAVKAKRPPSPEPEAKN